MKTYLCSSLALSVPFLLLAAKTAAQVLPRVGHVAAYGHVCPALDNPKAEPSVVHEHVVHRPGAGFLGLCLRDVVLGADSRIEVRSQSDGDTDIVTAATWNAGRPWTAYLNGDTVTVRLLAGPGTRGNRFTIGSLAIGSTGISGPANLCNPTDTRTLWIEARICRLMLNDGISLSVGTGWLIDYKGRLLTAGHVLQLPNLQSIQAQFNVPRSNANGTLVNPPATSQYAWNPDPARRASELIAAGPDWGVFEIVPNTVSTLFAGEAQRAVYTLQSPSSSIAEVYVTGHGSDDTPDSTYNHVLQTARGPLTAWMAAVHQIRYRVDTMGGTSGAPITDAGTGAAIGVHTDGGCTVTPGTYNAGTSVTVPAFQTQRDRISPDLPDLVARNMSAPQRVATDNPYTVGARVANLGRRPAGAMRVGVYLSTDATITTADTLLRTLSFPAFAAGQGGLLGGTFTVWGSVAPGNYWIGVIVDDEGVVTEGDESDNTRARPIEVYRGRADLVAGVDVATFPGPGIFRPGQSINAPIGVFNRGEAAAPASVTAVIHTRNVGMPLNDHVVLALVPTPPLAPNTGWQKTVPVVIPWCAANRPGDIGCYADAEEVIGEISEANNFDTYTGRGISNYSDPDRRIAYDPKLRTVVRSQDTATFRSTVGGDNASICVLRGSVDLTSQHYVLIWSFQQNPFAFDIASEASLSLLNGPVFTRWFTLIDDHNVGRAQITFPRLTSALAMTVWTHGVFLDSQMQVTGWVPRSIENVIVP